MYESDLKQLRVFSAIALHGNMTQASEMLFLTKPALSMALQELEKQLGQRLFDRVNNRLHLNSQGRRLLPMADELLQRAHQIEQTFQQDTELSGSLHIGASNTIGNYMLPQMLGHLSSSIRNVRRTSLSITPMIWPVSSPALSWI
ncbi:LysR family transcriptional regulator [Plesiomonas shigelloides subsp. oncorhynchi]|nr:LysR family transcriptional regulator [Plesiomonas shigelloides]